MSTVSRSEPAWMPPSLSRAALSGRLDAALDELGARNDPKSAWRRGWLLSAAGRYGEALDWLADARSRGRPATQAAALMTTAATLRQVALHEDAEEADREGLAVLKATDRRCAAIEAGLLVGLVADGVGRRVEAGVLARRRRVAAASVAGSGSWRQHVRLSWVGGEVAMLAQHFDLAARRFAQAARQALGQRAVRHEAKSLIFLAAARAARDERVESRRLAARGQELAERCGATPLIWPAALILAEVTDSEESAAHLQTARTSLQTVLDTLPPTLREAASSRSPADWLTAAAA